MAKLPRTDEGMLTSSTALRDVGAAGDVNMDPDDGGGGAAADAAATAEVSLEEILTLYNQPINEEQAWAVCYQCCRTLAQKQRRRGLKSASLLGGDPRRIEGPGDVMIGRDGTVKLQPGGDTGKPGLVDSLTHSLGLGRIAATRQRRLALSSQSLTGQGCGQEHLAQRPYCCHCLLWAMWRIVFTDAECELLIMHRVSPQRSCRCGGETVLVGSVSSTRGALVVVVVVLLFLTLGIVLIASKV